MKTLFYLSICLHLVASKPPNFVVILTDDQDVLLDGSEPMIKTKKILGENGKIFKNMFVTTPLCCPSRSSLLTGMYSHNTKTGNNSYSGGCSNLQWQTYHEKSTFASSLKKLNYTTFYAGKYLNQYGSKKAGGPEHIPEGWDWWNGLVGNSKYYDYSLSINGSLEIHEDDYVKDYLTDVIGRKATNFLDFIKMSERPFLMMLAPPAPHGPFTSAPQYKNRFENISSYRLPNFDSYGKDKHWLMRQVKHPMSEESLNVINKTFHQRWETLLSVDDLVEFVSKKLTSMGINDDTFIFFTSDNGFHLGQFGLPLDKRQFYEFDVRVPLIVKGPGISPSTWSTHLALNIDIAPTIVELAGGEVPTDVDGISLKSVLIEDQVKFQRDSFIIEHQGEGNIGIPDACRKRWPNQVSHCFPDCVCEDSFNNSYICIRTLNEEQNDVFCKFMDDVGFEEYYDLNLDPYQMVNAVYSLDVSQRQFYIKNLFLGINCSGNRCQSFSHKFQADIS